ncbi:MAG: tetratricopeptide repeat protein [Candidatus Obscuribacterales bacterium]|nr:tetratricopeptide repeat protein [Candidatus Obscuribacterales bacterium]
MRSRSLTHSRIVRSAYVAAAVLFLSAPAGAAVPDAQIRALDQKTIDGMAKRIEDGFFRDADLEVLTQLVGSQPNNAHAHYAMGVFLEQKGFEQLALDSFTRAVECEPRFSDAHYRRCLLVIRIEEPAVVDKELPVARDLLKNDGAKLFQIGLALEKAQRQADAKQLFEQASRAGRKQSGYGFTCASMRMVQGRFKDALEAIEWDLANDPKDSRALMLKGDILLHLNREADASKAYELAGRANPCSNATAVVAASHLQQLKDNRGALALYLLDLSCNEISRELLERSKAQIIGLGKVLSDSEFDDTVLSIEGELKKSRRCRAFQFALGDVFDRLGRYDRAIASYESGISACPSILSDNLPLARGFFRLGKDYEIHLRNYASALDMYRKASILAPQDKEITDRYARLKHRLSNKSRDFAWSVKDALRSTFGSSSPAPQR